MRTPQQIHKAKEYIKFFEAIPEEQWTTGNTFNWENGKKCALGHILNATKESGIDYCHPKSAELCEIISGEPFKGDAIAAWGTNDGCNGAFGNTPKERIINALKNAII